jgi:NAD(P)-dependent dehydrogenase (short-subunit alcohol dehydrogenase family)
MARVILQQNDSVGDSPSSVSRKALALYARPRGIGVSVLCPGSVDTNLHETERAIGVTPETALAEAVSRVS